MVDETKQVEVLMGPYAGHILTMPTAEADQAVADKWALDPPRYAPIDHEAPPLPRLTPEERETAEAAAATWAAAVDAPEPPAPPVLSSISPDTAVVGSAALTMTATGSGFTPESVIDFGGPLATTFVSDTELTCPVDPTGATAGTVPVSVRNGATVSDAVDFTFTAARRR